MPKPIVSLLLLILLVSGCASSPAHSLPTPAPTTAAPAFVARATEEAIPQLIAAEREASRNADLPLLAALWAEDGRIVDTRGTEEDADDFVWPNREAILDRYLVAVFPSPPPGLDAPPSPEMREAGETVQAVNGQDRWTFAWRDGRWWILELRY
jgi:hypothetical protein